MMQSTSEGCMDIAELANQLIREKISINSERQLLQNLNEQVEKSSLELLQTAWICSQQRQNLNNIITARSEAESVAACQRTSQLEDVAFIDVYKVLKYKEALALGELLGWLRESPHLVSLCLLLGEDHVMNTLIPSLVAGLYGSCRSHANRNRLLAVIRSLIKHQMVPSGDPRKLFRTGRGALATLFSVFRDGHSPARQFLIVALQGPIMAVLHEDEFYLDIDPDKSMERFSQSDRLKKFGQPNSPEYCAKVARYRKWAVQSLYNLTCKFIASLKEHWPGFPSAFAWILQQMMHLMKQHARTPERELHAICTDLIFNQYICPAIVNPEAHGVVEIPVSYIARFNLIQIAQIIQTLCRAKYQEIDPKVRDLYAKFDRSCVWSLIESVSSDGWAPAATPESPPQINAALYTCADAMALITYLKRISSKLNNNTPSVTSEELSSGSGPVAEAAALSETSSEGSLSWSEGGTSRLAALLQTVEPNYKSRLHDLLKKMPDFTQVRIPQTEVKEPVTVIENGHFRRGILAKVPKPRLPRSASSGSALSMADDKPIAAEREEKREKIHVLVIKLANVEDYDYVGMEPESKILECYYGGSEVDDPEDPVSGMATAPLPVQKRTRFSVSHDEVSIGNTSDNLEAVSEAASNHSVSSSLELETEDQNDNLSDMVSANVSGRGSPNISGRETPSSQVTDGDAPPRRPLPNVPTGQAAVNQAKLLKQARSEIDAKFCKFEIKKLLEGDETISIMSDTWSTDVLASDSETIGDSCDNTQVAANQGMNASNTTAPDVSETASESAWSIDVLASDSDRNTEVDTDDCVSVAARSDTSWPRRPSNQEESTPIKQATPNGSIRKAEINSPRHTPRPMLPNRSGGGYLSATAALCRGGELDLPADCRKSILVNGYPVMTCFAASAPESPSTSAPPNLPNDVFEFVPQNGPTSATESTLEGSRQSDATSQWVDDSFPPRPSTSRDYDEADLPSSDEGPNEDLIARMNAATISTTRVVHSELRTSVVVSSRSERKHLNEVSMSTLSVNSVESVSDRSSSQDVNSEIVTERKVSPPPKSSTGAIPKSISFDSTAEKSQRRRILGEEGLVGNFDEIKNNMKRSGGNILNKIKMFRQKGRGSQPAPAAEVKLPEEPPVRDDQYREEDSSEEILAKYRRGVESNKAKSSQRRPLLPTHSHEGVVDLNDPEVFNSMKRKLRVVLSNPDLHSMEYVPNRWTSASLVEFVRVCGARGGGAAARELARALATGGGARLAASLRADLAARRPYAAHLAAARQALTHALHAHHTQISVVQSECGSCVRIAGAARVLQQLERSNALKRLARQQRAGDDPAAHGGELMDEKATRLTACIKAITSEVKADPAWEGASATLLETAEITVERAAFARIYLHVLFPNGDGDIARDQVLSEHIRRLASCTSPASLGVAPRHAWGAPYARAQAALARLPVARAPRDKITCVLNCVRAIMAVLSLSDGAPPAADDLTPVLIYVIIRVNPPSLLSTQELVGALGGAALAGEALYWWTQFCSAVAYIKTMDYAVQDS